MPSLGLGLGYFITPKITFGLEHKTTFTMSDYYDGVAGGVDDNDIYHYTNGYIRFYLGSKNERDISDNTRPNNPQPPNVVTPPNTTNTLQPPVVSFIQPTSSPFTTKENTYNLVASVTNISNTQNIIFRQNGVVSNNFTYNAVTDKFASNVNLVAGQNVFTIIGTNQDGEDTETIIINYEQEREPLPVITYQNPDTNPKTVTEELFNLSATVLNIATKNQVNMQINGVAVSGFTFAQNTGVLAYAINLEPGANAVTITANNTAGSVTESTTIIYRPGATEQLPAVSFTNPISSPFTSNTENFNLSASVANISSANQLTFKQNGVVNNNFSFNTTNFSSNVVLIPGQNVFELVATNSAGTSQANTILIYNRAAPKPPVITITNPFTNPFTTTNNTATLAATVLNVQQTSQLQARLNGNVYTNYNFNAQNGNLSTTLNLQAGSNVFELTATNADGTDNKQTIIIYNPTQTVQAPVVSFTAPNANPYNTFNSAL
jgi:hypothetical protein